uniref:Uncharacterized protein n=1 Tax=Romanomermis culicivorax TaxID=13658 RepID=A0A915JRG6_ROMCU
MVWLKIEKPFSFESFCKDATVSGLANFLETRDRNCKFVWIVANVVCISAAVVLCYSSIAYYLAYEVKTTMKVIGQDVEPNFPAITFCTTSLMRTSFKHNNTKYGSINSDIMSIYDPDEANETYSCKDTAVFPSDRFRTAFNNYYDYLTIYALTYQDMVLLCWFAGNRVPCTNDDRYFKLALTDLGPCFTFNEIRKTPSESGIFGR